MPAPKQSPWGAVDHQEELAPGIYFCSTPSHGGIYLEPAMWAQMPVELRETTYSHGGWYEEDCDWALVAKVFPKAFTADQLELAERYCRDVHKLS